ncbi:unnamed protein product, partial [Prorocentrum cordatum]
PGLAKVTGELKKTNLAFASLQEAVALLQSSKAEAAALEVLRHEAASMVNDANLSVAAMRQSVGNVVNDVREHFRTASQTIAAHNATFITEVRSQYQEELAAAARLRDEVQEFVAQTGKRIGGLDTRVAEASAKAGSLAAEAREELEELNRRRKRDKTSSDNELKALKKRLGGVFDNSDMVLRGLEHIYGVLQTVLQGELMQCSMERQDSIDRKRIALMGVKDDEAVIGQLLTRLLVVRDVLSPMIKLVKFFGKLLLEGLDVAGHVGHLDSNRHCLRLASLGLLPPVFQLVHLAEPEVHPTRAMEARLSSSPMVRPEAGMAAS